MKKLLKDKHYVIGAGLGVIAEYGVSWYVNKKLSELGYSPEIIAPATSAAKSAGFFIFNTGYYWLSTGFEGAKVLATSNFKGLSVSFGVRTLAHYTLMLFGVPPESAYWLVYPAAGVLGTVVKLNHDNKNLEERTTMFKKS